MQMFLLTECISIKTFASFQIAEHRLVRIFLVFFWHVVLWWLLQQNMLSIWNMFFFVCLQTREAAVFHNIKDVNTFSVSSGEWTYSMCSISAYRASPNRPVPVESHISNRVALDEWSTARCMCSKTHKMSADRQKLLPDLITLVLYGFCLQTNRMHQIISYIRCQST